MRVTWICSIAVLLLCGSANAAKLRLIRIDCNKQEDFTGGDHPYLKFDGEKIWGPKKTKTGESHSLKDVDAKEFTGEVVLQLFEEDDLDDDDVLGKVTLKAADAGAGVKKASFTEDEADYTVQYEILP